MEEVIKLLTEEPELAVTAAAGLYTLGSGYVFANGYMDGVVKGYLADDREEVESSIEELEEIGKYSNKLGRLKGFLRPDLSGTKKGLENGLKYREEENV